MIESWLQVSAKLTSNNHFLSFSSSHAHIYVMSASYLVIWFYCFDPPLFITCCVSRHKCANDSKYRTDNRWYCLMMCYSFFFYHYQLFSSSRLCWHVRVSYASIAIRSTGSSFPCRQGVVIHYLFYRKQKQRIHNTTPSVDLTLTRRQSDTTPLRQDISSQ
jgi:hypothetical protein